MDSFIDFFSKIFDSTGFMPRWQCGSWTSAHGWMYILSNLNIGIAYLTIPLMLVLFIRKRKDAPFPKIFLLFSLFIITCGLTHIVDATMFWTPLYRLNAVLLFITAIISTITVGALYKTMPKALSFKSPAELQLIIDQQTAELQLAYQKLKASEEQFKALVNNNPDTIMLMGKNLEYKFVNDSLAKLTNMPTKDFLGKRPVDVLPTHPHTSIYTSELERVIQTGKSTHYEVKANSDKIGDGYFAIDMIPLTDKIGNVANVLTITKDVTHIRENELILKETIAKLDKLTKRLEFKRNTLQDFAYIVSHNLRSPTGNLIALMDIYKRTEDPEKKEFLMSKFFDVAVQLAVTVQDLSEVLNINQNKEVERENLSFRTVLENQITNNISEIMRLNAHVHYDFSECESINYPKIYLDSILLNLLTNALKYSSTDRTPEISFTTNIDANGLITLYCKDNGLGIDLKKYGSKIFSLHKTFHQRADARGVGLFITKQQIKSLGGDIEVQSEPNVGTTFIIKFNKIEIL